MLWILACVDLSGTGPRPDSGADNDSGFDTEGNVEPGACDEPSGCGLEGEVPVYAHGLLLGYREEGFTGRSVSYAGDVDGDGDDDVLVTTTAFRSDEGAAHLVLSPFRGSSPLDDVAIVAGEGSGSHGYGAGSAGDLDGDGRDDVLVCTREGGAALILDPLVAGLDVGSDNAVYHGEAGAIGSATAGPGEYDGDSGAELLFADGSGGGAPAYSALVFDSVLTGGGDMNGDGYGDVLVGNMYGTRAGDDYTGEVYLFYGGVP